MLIYSICGLIIINLIFTIIEQTVLRLSGALKSHLNWSVLILWRVYFLTLFYANINIWARLIHIANVIFLRKDVITLVFYINWLVSFWNILFAALPQNIIILLPYIGTRLILLTMSWSWILIHRNDKSIVMLNHVWNTWSNQV